MANRLIRDRAITSESVDMLSAEAERCFYRLILCADDWGRFEARRELLIAKLFPLKVKHISEEEMEAWLLEMEGAGIVTLYRSGGREYGEFSNWAKHNTIRNKQSKFPGPPTAEATPCSLAQSIADKGNGKPARKGETMAESGLAPVTSEDGRTTYVHPDDLPQTQEPANICGQLQTDAGECSQMPAFTLGDEDEVGVVFSPKITRVISNPRKPPPASRQGARGSGPVASNPGKAGPPGRTASGFSRSMNRQRDLVPNDLPVAEPERRIGFRQPGPSAIVCTKREGRSEPSFEVVGGSDRPKEGPKQTRTAFQLEFKRKHDRLPSEEEHPDALRLGGCEGGDKPS